MSRRTLRFGLVILLIALAGGLITEHTPKGKLLEADI